jgi:hypothetical protein
MSRVYRAFGYLDDTEPVTQQGLPCPACGAALREERRGYTSAFFCPTGHIYPTAGSLLTAMRAPVSST